MLLRFVYSHINQFTYNKNLATTVSEQRRNIDSARIKLIETKEEL